MKIKCKTTEEIAMMRRAGKILASCHQALLDRIRPGVSTWDIDQFVENYLRMHHASPAQKGYRGYRFATCASVNDVIAHGFPNRQPLVEGDIVTIDMVVNVNGWLADSAWTYAVGHVSETSRKLMRTTHECLLRGIEQAVPGNRTGDIGHAIEMHARQHGFQVVRDLLGHGIGRAIHEPPAYVHAGPKGSGERLKPGMVITVEPMLTEGSADIWLDADGWTVRTMDGRRSAQYEHTVAITLDGPMILTEI